MNDRIRSIAFVVLTFALALASAACELPKL